MNSFLKNMAQGAKRLGSSPLTVVPGIGPALGSIGLAGAGGALLLNRRQNNPQRLGEMGADATADQIANAADGGFLRQEWDDSDWNTFQSAQQQALENQVRAGKINPQTAEELMNRYAYSMDQQAQGSSAGGGYNSGLDPKVASQISQDQAAAQSAYADMYGDPNDMGLPTGQQFQQLSDFARANSALQNQLGDEAVAAEAARTWQHIRPLERDRNYEQFQIGEAQASNNTRRQMANNLLNTYAATTQQLIGSGLR